MRFTLFLLAFLFLPFISHTQNSEFISKNKIVYFKPDGTGGIEFFEKNYHTLGFKEMPQVKQIYENKDKAGMKHIKYRQYYKGVEVTGADYVLHIKDGKVIKSTGILFPGINLDVKPGIDAAGIKDIALALGMADREMRHDGVAGTNGTELSVEKPVLCIVDKAFPEFSGRYVLAYRVIVQGNAIDKPYKKEFYIDANTGKMIFAEEKIHYESVPSKGESLYYGLLDFECDSVAPHTFLLQNLDRGSGIFVRNAENWSIFSDDDNYWAFDKEGETAGIDAYYAAVAYYDLLKEKFGRNSIDDKAFPLEARVNVSGMVNAYWDGRGSVFGNGDCYRYGPFTSLAIVGHEFTHGLTDFTSQLIYQKEPGALNESMSDIFGQALAFNVDSTRFSWMLGKTIARDDTIRPFRSMEDPSVAKDPKYYKGENWVTEPLDNYGVHSNSGVFNYWFYLLSEGAKGINEKGDSFDVKPLGLNKALDIVYQMQVNYLNRYSGYSDAYDYSIEAVKDLFGADSGVMESVLEAWKAVGIPKELTARNVFNFKFSYNGNSSLGEKMCLGDFENIILELSNKGDTVIKQGTTVSIFIKLSKENFDNNKVALDSFEIDTILSKDWQKGDKMEFALNFDSEKYYFPHYRIFLDVKAQFGPDSLDMVVEDEQAFYLMDKDYDFWGNITFRKTVNCKVKKQLSLITLIMYNRGCNEYNEEEDTIFMIVENGSNVYKVDIAPQMVYDGRYFGFDILNRYFDFESLDDISLYSINIYFKHGDRIFPVTQRSLQNVITETVYLDKKLTFSSYNDLNKYMVVVDKGFYVKKDIINGWLHVYSDKTPEKLEDCLPYDDYFNVMHDFKMNIMMCLDLDTLKEPYITFDLDIKDTYTYKENSDYSHMFDLLQGDESILSSLITGTGNKKKHFKLNLDKNDKKPLMQFQFLTIGTNIYIDNIEVRDWKKDAVEDAAKSFSIGFNNPVDDYLRVNPGDYGGTWSLRLYNTSGTVLYSRDNITGACNVEMPYPPGMYFIRIMDRQGRLFTGKVVKGE